MTFDPWDLVTLGPKSHTHIQTTNGTCISIDHTASVDISPSIHLNNCLLIPSLSHKLLYISKLTNELNCTILMTSSNCIVQDAQTRTIIGRGIEKRGLYYVDEVGQYGHTSLAHGSTDHQLWMWHRNLGHPSLGYLKRLFPSFKIAIFCWIVKHVR